ncbi:MAG: hypothetical protein AAF840_01050 [Bacteroidota bacterium]
MKRLFFLLLLCCPFFVIAQADQQEIALEGATEVHIYAEFSSVSVTTGGIDAVAVSHTLTIEGEDRPDLRKLTVERKKNGVLILRELKPTAKLLNREYPEPDGGSISGGREGGKGVFNGVMVDATLEVVVPEGVKVSVATNFGQIKAVNVAGLMKATAKYGAVDVIFATVPALPALELYSNYGTVDVTIPAGRGIDVDLTTKYGELLTDLDINIDTEESKEGHFFQHLIGKISGGGRVIKCEAPYGDVYLREG